MHCVPPANTHTHTHTHTHISPSCRLSRRCLSQCHTMYVYSGGQSMQLLHFSFPPPALQCFSPHTWVHSWPDESLVTCKSVCVCDPNNLVEAHCSIIPPVLCDPSLINKAEQFTKQLNPKVRKQGTPVSLIILCEQCVHLC